MRMRALLMRSRLVSVVILRRPKVALGSQRIAITDRDSCATCQRQIPFSNFPFPMPASLLLRRPLDKRRNLPMQRHTILIM
jgi:hypothetical protein